MHLFEDLRVCTYITASHLKSHNIYRSTPLNQLLRVSVQAISKFSSTSEAETDPFSFLLEVEMAPNDRREREKPILYNQFDY